MAKTRAPLLSIEASGSLAKVLIMSRGRRQSYTKYSRKPKDPKTDLQLSRRAWFSILTSQWKRLSDYQQGSWTPLLKPNEDNLKFAYMRGNFAYIDRGEWPSAEYPATRTLTVANIDPMVCTGGARHVHIEQDLTTLSYNWLLLLFRIASPPQTLTPQKLLHAIEASASVPAGPYFWTDTPLAPGPYYYYAGALSLDGKVRLNSSWYWGIAT